ncbi:MAG: fumarylacetoacetate hydrolase family protein [Planctomycetes bacterium]|nr:fumarylacetoacetate hydrolase family protein [Planctomycetota bacterium]
MRGDFEVLPPIISPSKIVCVIRNYKAHAKEMAASVPEEPIFFLKPASALIGHKQNILFPRWLNSRVDPEIELGVVIGKTCKNASVDSAMQYVAGYTIILDVTARSLQGQDKERSWPWTRSKGLDTFCPTGPFLVPREIVEDPHCLDIELQVNGGERQKGNTSDMVFTVPELISAASKYMTLQPGDMIATGTPEGVSPVVIGDYIEATIEKLGTLKITVSSA